MNCITRQSGFSLVEVLVAITLLLIALVGPMTFFARNSQSAEVANDRTIAAFLAQEGAELIQKDRDDRVLQWFEDPENNDEPWQDFLNNVSDCRDSECGVEISVWSTEVTDCSNQANCQLYYNADADRNRYNHQGDGDTTPYTRIIRLSSSDYSREVTITSTVEWETSALRGTQQVEVQTTIFNVFDND